MLTPSSPVFPGAAGTKTLVVHGQNECDIPTQLPVHEDTQFEALLKVGALRVSRSPLTLTRWCMEHVYIWFTFRNHNDLHLLIIMIHF